MCLPIDWTRSQRCGPVSGASSWTRVSAGRTSIRTASRRAAAERAMKSARGAEDRSRLQACRRIWKPMADGLNPASIRNVGQRVLGRGDAVDLPDQERHAAVVGPGEAGEPGRQRAGRSSSAPARLPEGRPSAGAPPRLMYAASMPLTSTTSAPTVRVGPRPPALAVAGRRRPLQDASPYGFAGSVAASATTSGSSGIVAASAADRAPPAARTASRRRRRRSSRAAPARRPRAPSARRRRRRSRR